MKTYTKSEILMPAIPNTKDYVFAALLYLASTKEAIVRKCNSKSGEESTTRTTEYENMAKKICPDYRIFSKTNVYESCINDAKDVFAAVKTIANHIESTGLCKL